MTTTQAMFRYVILLLSIPIVAAYSNLARSDTPPIRFGSVAMDTPQMMHKRLYPLTEYLQNTLSRPVELVLTTNMQDAINALVQGSVDIAYLTPVAYVRARERSAAQLVVKTQTNNEDAFKLMIAVRENNAINTVSDLKGKRFAFGDPEALLQRAVVASQIDLSQLGEIHFLDHYDNIVRGVLHRDYDAGILKDTMAYKWQNRGIRILYASEPLPPYNITATAQLDHTLLSQIQAAFLRLNPNGAQQQKIIKALDPNYTGFTVGHDSDYEIVRHLIQPFEKVK